jgi:hypothetical protein
MGFFLSFRLEQRVMCEGSEKTKFLVYAFQALCGMEKSKMGENKILSESQVQRIRCLHSAQSTFTFPKWTWMLISECAPVGMTRVSAAA